ncbi:mitotic checkpoint serine/threonine-protein kinase BUB1-like [Onthophagus taurus]|uniref:mitotic checkpoint serine/threonine-protein kinase BUB1-like n=1 Tax=Onthophagus taurus TaxID=166361 RepID=UPI0039BDFA90
MDFDNSKENIQPLRGGRNPTQLGVAIQAQNSADLQRELMQQKQEFENAIRTYTGDDPLENYYSYISWIEQSFPKHGHEGNLLPFLEDCLKKFEDDKRYLNDRRFCKLWIKFIDYQQNPIELYHMLFSKGLCKGCADFYRAWSFYHEVMGDFKNADLVLNCGIREHAQPYEELLAAQQSLIFAAGQQVISGVNEERLQHQRNALTSLHIYKSGRVGNTRHSEHVITHHAHSGMHPGHSTHPQNAGRVFNVYQDYNDDYLAAGAAPNSVLDIAKREICVKENLMKPGVWTNATVGHTNSAHRTSAFLIHEDRYDVHQRNLQIPQNFARSTNECYSSYVIPLNYMEPYDPMKITKYPKNKVYPGDGTEYSLEEIKSAGYVIHLSVNIPENESISSNLEMTQMQSNSRTSANKSNLNLSKIPCIIEPNTTTKEMNLPRDESLISKNPPPFEVFNDSIPNNSISQQPNLATTKNFYVDPKMPILYPEVTTPNLHPEINTQQSSPLIIDDLWASKGDLDAETTNKVTPKKNMNNFVIFNDSNLREPNTQPKGSAMKTPLKTLSTDDLVETGSRGGLDIAMAAQPVDSARNVTNLDDRNPIYQGTGSREVECPDTQMFNFNLNAMKVSTPQSKEQQQQNVERNVNNGSTKKVLFERLSTILEESKTYSSSGSSGSSALKSTLLNSKKLCLQEQSTFHINLEQNLKANAALRSRSLGEFIDCAPEHHTSTIESPSMIHPVVQPTTIAPLMSAPDDPFKTSLIETLLERINFPGQHIYGYTRVYEIPRIVIKKEYLDVGREKYYIEKLIGKGAFGSVYKAEDCQTRQTVAVKYQRPPNKWEYYICRELQARLAGNHMKDRFMDIHRGYYSDQVSILISDFNPNGSLLDITNKLKQKNGRAMKESLCAYFCIEMLQIISAMHSTKIIHADIKPDNFLVQLVDNNVKLHLIDFGCSIDMAMFPHGTTFLRKVTTEDFTCCEMLDGRPWSYHTDLFCVAASAHVLLFDKYIQMQKKDDHWSIKHRFSRYYRVDCWNMFFSTLLNQQNGPAKIDPLIQMLSGIVDMGTTEFQTEMRTLVNMLRGR